MVLHKNFPSFPHAILEPEIREAVLKKKGGRIMVEKGQIVKVMDIFGNDTMTIIEVSV